MAVNSNFEVDSIGGGLGGYGFGGGLGFLPWLLLFAKDGGLFGNGNGAGAGVLAGQTQSKLDCLAQGHEQLSMQIAGNRQDGQFAALNAQLSELESIGRDNQLQLADRINALSAQNAECYCELREGQQEIKTSIAMQTNELNVNANANTQRILDALNAQNISVLENDNARLREQLNRSEIIGAINSECGHRHGGGNTTVDVDIITLIRSLSGGGFTPPGQGAQVAAPKA